MALGQTTYKVRYEYTCDEGSDLVTLPNGKQEKVKRLKTRTPTRRVEIEDGDGEPKNVEKALLEVLTASHHRDNITEIKILGVDQVGDDGKQQAAQAGPDRDTAKSVQKCCDDVAKCCDRIDALEKVVESLSAQTVESLRAEVASLSEEIAGLKSAKEPVESTKPKTGGK